MSRATEGDLASEGRECSPARLLAGPASARRQFPVSMLFTSQHVAVVPGPSVVAT